LPVEAVTEVQPLIESFDFSIFGRAPARFDMEELAALNARVIHQLPFGAVAERLSAGMDEAGWEAIRPNLSSVAEAAAWWHIVQGPIEPGAASEEREFLLAAAEEAEGLNWAAAPWTQLVAALKSRTGRGGKALFLPLRRALTGRDSGPEMAALLPLIGRDQTIARLHAAG
jgi:glutamyl-tRNA synthetase